MYGIRPEQEEQNGRVRLGLSVAAVGIIDPDGNRTVTQFPGHKEGVVCERWLDALDEANIRPAVVEAGIHYDGLGREGIGEVLGVLEELLGDLLRMLNEALVGKVNMKTI